MRNLMFLLFLLVPLAGAAETRNEMLARGISSTEYGLNIQRGLVDGVSVIHKYGANPDIDTADGFEVLWGGGGPYTGFDATAAETIEVFSSSALDTAAGTGAQMIELRGLTAGFVPLIEVVVFNGVTPVDTVGTFIRMDRALVITAGSLGENAGSLTIRQKTTTANVFAVIQPGNNRTTIAAYTVPFGKLGYVKNGFASLSKKQASASVIRARVRVPGSVFQIIESFAVNSTGSSYVFRDFVIPLDGVPAGSDLLIDADTNTNDNGVAGGFEIILVDVP